MRTQLIALVFAMLPAANISAECFDGKKEGHASTLLRIKGESIVYTPLGLSVCYNKQTYALANKLNDTNCGPNNYTGTLQQGVRAALGADLYKRIVCIGEPTPVYANPADQIPAQLLIHVELLRFKGNQIVP